MTVRQSDRVRLKLVRAAMLGTSLMLVNACGETEYNVGSGQPNSALGGSHTQGGSALGDAGAPMGYVAAGTGAADWGVAGRGAGGAAGRSFDIRGGDGGAPDSGAGSPAMAGNGATDMGGGAGGVGGSNSEVGGTVVGAAGRGSAAGSSTLANSGGAVASSGGASTASVAGTTSGGATSRGGASAAGSAGAWPCGVEPNPSGDRSKRKMVLRDEGVAKLAFIDVGNAKNSWVVTIEREASTGIQGRDIQLIGNCRILVGTDLGYEEYALENGNKLTELTAYPGTVSAHRLRNRNTQLLGVGTTASPYQSSVGIVLLEIDPAGTIVNKIVYPGTYARLVRQTPTGTFLVTNNTKVFEGDATGNVLSPTFTIGTSPTTHSWKALRVPGLTGTGETVVSTGYIANLMIFQADGTVRRTISGGSASIVGGATAVNPYFFADVQVLANGNYVVANWRGHGTGNFLTGIPVLEYTPAGALAWVWGDPTYADRLSSIQGVIVMDGIDPTKLHVEDTNGQEVPVD